MYCNIWNKNRKAKKKNIFRKALSLSIDYSKCGHEYDKVFKEEEWNEIAKILGLINVIKEYQKVYNHVWRN